jgi:tRNA pseudouridine38-40 synthase
VLAYDGSGYFGFQRQAGSAPTIQGAVEQALEHITRQPVLVTGAGRTDTGVHATGQVIAFDVDWSHSTDKLWNALNANLPDSIAVQSLDEAAADFHPRFDARSRVYQYTLYAAPVRQPVLSRYAWLVPSQGALNVAAMQIAAACLVGVGDFATFGQPPQGENTVREVMQSEIVVLPGLVPAGQVLRYQIEANAFLYRMVRRIVAALVRVGLERLTIEVFEAAFRAANSRWPNQTAPAHGLCLTQVIYEEERGDARWSK